MSMLRNMLNSLRPPGNTVHLFLAKETKTWSLDSLVFFIHEKARTNKLNISHQSVQEKAKVERTMTARFTQLCGYDTIMNSAIPHSSWHNK